MEVSGRRQALSGIPCDPCLIDNVSENAQFYCTHCDEFLCETCTRNHRKSKASRQHQLLDRDEMPKKNIGHDQDKFCAIHGGRLIDYVCVKHDTLCCSACVTLDHVQCGVKYIDEFAKGYSSSEEYRLLIKQFKDYEKQLAKFKNKTQKTSIDVNECFRRLKADIQLFRNEINSKIDALEFELIQQAVNIKSDDLKPIEFYDEFQAYMSDISTDLELLEKCKQNHQLYISAQKGRIKVEEFKFKARSMAKERTVRRYAFSRNDDILNTLNSPRKLGTLEFQKEGDRPRPNTLSKQAQKGVTKEENPRIVKLAVRNKGGKTEERVTQSKEKTTKTDTFKPTKATFAKNIYVKHREDSYGCWITGSVLMSSYILAVTDYNNKSIKVVDLRTDSITCYIKLDDRPWDVACMDPETIVVTCNTYLAFLCYVGTLAVVKKVPMEPGCSGISFRKGKLFVTFDGKHPSVKILNVEGNVLRTFQNNPEEQCLFICPQYITVNSDGDTMYVSDMKQNTVTRLSMKGKVCNIYTHENLRGPEGLTLGDDDSIYVVGHRSYNIHEVTTSRTPARIVLDQKDGIVCPQTVLYNNTDKTLYVSCVCISSEQLSVYKLG